MRAVYKMIQVVQKVDGIVNMHRYVNIQYNMYCTFLNYFNQKAIFAKVGVYRCTVYIFVYAK